MAINYKNQDVAAAVAEFAEILRHSYWAKDGDLAQAARHVERALALDPTNPLALRYAAVLLRNLMRLDEAIALDEHMVAHDPVNPIGFSNLGFKYLYAGRWDEAIAAYRDALRLSPGYIGAQFYIGVALMLSGQPEAAHRAAPQHIRGDHPGDAGEQPRRGGQERGERAGRHQRGEHPPGRAVTEGGPGQQHHHRVGRGRR